MFSSEIEVLLVGEIFTKGTPLKFPTLANAVGMTSQNCITKLLAHMGEIDFFIQNDRIDDE